MPNEISKAFITFTHVVQGSTVSLPFVKNCFLGFVSIFLINEFELVKLRMKCSAMFMSMPTTLESTA